MSALVAQSTRHRYLPARMIGMLWRLSSGYRFRPWASPYLKWRIETWSGIEAESITPGLFWRFCWSHRKDLIRYLRWAGENSSDGL